MSEETKVESTFKTKQWVDWIGKRPEMFEIPKSEWEWSFHKSFNFRVQTNHAPCFLHRLMQKWVLGVHWRKNDFRVT